MPPPHLRPGWSKWLIPPIKARWYETCPDSEHSHPRWAGLICSGASRTMYLTLRVRHKEGSTPAVRAVPHKGKSVQLFLGPVNQEASSGRQREQLNRGVSPPPSSVQTSVILFPLPSPTPTHTKPDSTAPWIMHSRALAQCSPAGLEAHSTLSRTTSPARTNIQDPVCYVGQESCPIPYQNSGDGVDIPGLLPPAPETNRFPGI